MSHTYHLFSIFLLLLLAGCSKPAWKLVESKEGGFSVMMPATPIEAVRPITTTVGRVEAHIFFLEKRDVVYIAGHAPIALTERADPKAVRSLFDAVRKAAVSGVSGQLLSESPLSTGGHPGRELRIALPDTGRIAKVRIVLVGGRLVFVVAVAGWYEEKRDSGNRFLDSLVFL